MKTMNKTTPATTYLSEYQEPDYLIDEVELDFSLNADEVLVKALLHVHAGKEKAQDLVLNGQHMELVSVCIDGKKLTELDYGLGPESLTVFNPPASFLLEVVTKINPTKNTSLEGLYCSNNIYCTQCEPEGFRKITYFLDRPDVMATYKVNIEADKARFPVLLANGNLIDSGDLAGGRHFAKWHDPYRKPCYLFAMVAGDLVRVADQFTTKSGRQIDLHIYVEAHNQQKCGHAMRSLQKAMAWDEEVFGLEYDLDLYMILAVDDFNSGAMENKGLNIFNSKYVLAQPETATDDDYEGIEAVIAHEYFHNWTGNRVTCRDWFQLSLKEGLTVFRDQEFSADMISRGVKRINDVRMLRNHQFPEDAGPMAHPVRPASYIEINNFYTLTVYEKGAEVIRMFHTILGKELFRQALDLYFERYDGQAVTTDDFAACMADTYNAKNQSDEPVDFKQFSLWYSQAGTPKVAVSSAYDESEQRYTLTFSQQKPAVAGADHQMMLLPIKTGLLDQGGNDLELHLAGKTVNGKETVLMLTKEKESFAFENVSCRPVPSLLRGFSAPVKLHYDYSDEELLFLLLNDSDSFNRWEAGQLFYSRRLLELVKRFQAGAEMSQDSRFDEIFTGLLKNEKSLDKSFVAQLISLPSEDYLAELMDEVDVDAIHAARQFVRKTAASSLRETFLAIYQENKDDSPYRYDAELAGRRRLKNGCLAYLAAIDDPQITALVSGQLAAGNMSDEICALKLLAHKDCPERTKALAVFHDKWRHEPLVMDKWFAVQATAPLAGCLNHVQDLLGHPLFSIKNPNKVRALIGSFAAGNPTCFHDKSGTGYQFLANKVIELDRLNPHMAARMLGRLSRWRKYDQGRQLLMRSELERVMASKNISKGVYEVCLKSLEG